MTSSVVLYILLVLGGLLFLVALFMFGQAVWETVVAVFRIFFATIGAVLRFFGSSLLALGWYITGVLLLAAIGGGVIGYTYWFKAGGFDLAGVRPPVCTELLDRKGNVLDYLCPFEGVRVWRPLESISTNLRMLVVMLEDDKFYEHGGLDIDEIWNSLETDLEKHKIARGGSTITQQLAKNLFLSKEKSLLRKASEVPIAMRLEREFTKDQILELYLNTIEWGPGIFGIEAASRLYFDHEASALKEEEAWLLALMIPNPKELCLWSQPRAKRSILHRARHLATRLYQEHRMSKAESEQAYATFEAFIENWSTTKPLALRGGRKYPARWGNEHTFSVAEVVSVRRGAAGLLKRFRQAPVRLNIDRELQEKLEALQPAIHAHDLSDMLAVMEGSEIRGMIPVTKSKLAAEVKPIAEAQGFTTQVFPARNIPPGALWP
ncbi:MAG: penicillin-binding protein [Deltaproteobacteria bacterium]|nr:penicillin-binding protein [Deltaproteobacteria bacterium]